MTHYYSNIQTLLSMGWSQAFQQHLTLDEVTALEQEDMQLARISAIHRNRIQAQTAKEEINLLCPNALQPVSQHLGVGAWVIFEQKHEHNLILRIIPAKNQIERLSGHSKQLIAANLDYLWIVTSANTEFNINRLQRYLTLAYESHIEPVVILTKTDLCEDKYAYLDEIKRLKVNLVHDTNLYQEDLITGFESYLKAGNSIALVGSSGVGKSSLINRLSGSTQVTKAIREDDDKGKHTTTHRQLLFTHQGVAIIDTPGMRELQLYQSEVGMEQAFEDLVQLAQSCRFHNCQHHNEPGCAIQAALHKGEIQPQYLNNYIKLQKEDAFLKRKEIGAYAERSHHRAFSKKVSQMTRNRWQDK